MKDSFYDEDASLELPTIETLNKLKKKVQQKKMANPCSPVWITSPWYSSNYIVEKLVKLKSIH